MLGASTEQQQHYTLTSIYKIKLIALNALYGGFRAYKNNKGIKWML